MEGHKKEKDPKRKNNKKVHLLKWFTVEHGKDVHGKIQRQVRHLRRDRAQDGKREETEGGTSEEDEEHTSEE